MKKINLNIPDMQSSHCMNRVKNAVSAIDGVQIEKLSPGRMEVSVQDAHADHTVLEAVVKAGYTASFETETVADTCHSACCTDQLK